MIWSGHQTTQPGATTALTETTIVASILSPITSLALGYLLYSDHVHSFQPSSLLSLYFTLSTAAEIIRCRTFFLRPFLNVVGGLSLVIAICKVVIVVLQEIPKPLQEEPVAGEKLAQDAVAGFWNRTFLFWINSTLFIGFRRSLSMDDLGNLGPGFSSTRLVQKFERRWERGMIYLTNCNMATFANAPVSRKGRTACAGQSMLLYSFLAIYFDCTAALDIYSTHFRGGVSITGPSNLSRQR